MEHTESNYTFDARMRRKVGIITMSEYSYQYLTALENELIFPSFSRADAAALGAMLDEEGRMCGCPIAIEITINGLVVFRYFQDGCPPDSTNWLARKRRVIDEQGMGSLRFGMMLEENGETLEDHKIDSMNYAPGGGGMPITLAGTGIIGSVCVSGCPDHLMDQTIVSKGMRRLLAVKTQQ